MVPQEKAVALFVQLRNTDTILVWGSLLRNYVHRYFCEIHICADADCRRYPRGLKYIPNHGDGH